MTMFATVDDVIARWDGTIALEQLESITTMLSDAERKVAADRRVRSAGGLMALIIAGRTTAEDVKLVLCDMVIRVLRNTGGVRTQTVGPFSYTLDQQVASGRLFVSREDWALLGVRAGAATVSLSDADAALEHLPVRPRCEPLPLPGWPATPNWPSSESSTW